MQGNSCPLRLFSLFQGFFTWVKFQGMIYNSFYSPIDNEEKLKNDY